MTEIKVTKLGMQEVHHELSRWWEEQVIAGQMDPNTEVEPMEEGEIEKLSADRLVNRLLFLCPWFMRRT